MLVRPDRRARCQIARHRMENEPLTRFCGTRDWSMPNNFRQVLPRRWFDKISPVAREMNRTPSAWAQPIPQSFVPLSPQPRISRSQPPRLQQYIVAPPQKCSSRADFVRSGALVINSPGKRAGDTCSGSARLKRTRFQPATGVCAYHGC